MLAEGARAIGAGNSISARAGDGRRARLARRGVQHDGGRARDSRERLEQSARPRAKNLEVEARRRYIETILERVATGVISLDARGRISTVNGAAQRLLGLEPRRGRAAGDRRVRARRSAAAAAARRRGRRAARRRRRAGDHARARRTARCTWPPPRRADRRRRQLEGAVLVLDDVTPLIRAQRVAAWRDVARRLAHEIKNPLTPIQLSAERLRRHFAAAPPPTRALVDECTDAIIAEVEALKGLVDEFAQFARLRGPRLLPTDLNALVDEALRAVRRRARRRTSAIEHRSPPTCRPCGSTPSRFGRSSSIWWTTRSRRSAGRGAQRPASAADDRVATAHDARNACVAPRRQRQRPRRAARGPRQAVHAVLLDQGTRQRPRPGDRAPHRRRARRRHRGRRPRAAGARASPSSCRPEPCAPRILIVDDEAGVAVVARRRAARRRLRRRRRRQRRGLPRSASRAAATTSSCSTSGCPGIDGLATLERLRERSVDAPVIMISGPRQHRVGGAGDEAGRLRLHREAAVAREDGAGRPQRAAAAPARGREPRAARARRRRYVMVGESTRWRSCASRSRWRRRPTAAC